MTRSAGPFLAVALAALGTAGLTACSRVRRPAASAAASLPLPPALRAWRRFFLVARQTVSAPLADLLRQMCHPGNSAASTAMSLSLLTVQGSQGRGDVPTALADVSQDVGSAERPAPSLKRPATSGTLGA